jgi:hypothetical protein
MQAVDERLEVLKEILTDPVNQPDELTKLISHD